MLTYTMLYILLLQRYVGIPYRYCNRKLKTISNLQKWMENFIHSPFKIEDLLVLKNMTTF